MKIRYVLDMDNPEDRSLSVVYSQAEGMRRACEEFLEAHRRRAKHGDPDKIFTSSAIREELLELCSSYGVTFE